MKKLLSIIALSAIMASCNSGSDADNTADSTKDAIDSAANAKKDAIDSAADAKKDKVDSMADKKDSAAGKK